MYQAGQDALQTARGEAARPGSSSTSSEATTTPVVDDQAGVNYKISAEDTLSCKNWYSKLASDCEPSLSNPSIETATFTRVTSHIYSCLPKLVLL